MNARSSRVVILGGGPGGYEAALVGAHLGAEVTVVERDGLGGAAVLTDCVPSKTLISTADYMSDFETAHELGVHLEDAEGDEVADAVADLREVNTRVLDLAAAQSDDIATRLAEVGVRVLAGCGVLTSATTVRAETPDGVLELEAD
ncbi:MAG: FAD-dependent oxidoreductase, partial [Ornithinibacter sp.]